MLLPRYVWPLVRACRGSRGFSTRFRGPFEQGIITAAKTIQLRVPLVVRLQGNKVDEAKKLIFDSGLRIIAADDLDEAGKKAVKLAEIVQIANTVDVNVSFKLPL
mmetsp:Transcript_43499/g.170154  ORF Transcript_43499/g.170154 Transcript_43499/m.170154 type:complete len:105 (+) Transcript_43499:1223-1537(+)